RFAGALDDAAEHRKRHRSLDVLQPLFERLNRTDHVEALPRAAGAGDDAHAAIADAHRLQNLVADADFFFRFGRERYADRVADPGPQQRTDAERRLDGAANQAAGLRDSEVQRAIDLASELLVGRDRKKHVTGLHRHLVFAEAVVLEDADMVERAFDQRLGAGLAV